MNISNLGFRMGVACAAAASLASLSACTSSDGEETRSASRTVQDLQQLQLGQYVPPYDQYATIGQRCILVTYDFQVEDNKSLYEFVLYGKNQSVITRSRGASASDIEDIMNSPPPDCN